jgi:uncharacterized protein
MRKRAGLLQLAILFSAVFTYAAETPIPPAPTRWVTDVAGFMSPSAVNSLDAQIEQYAKATNHQLLVYIGKTTGDAPIEDWAVRAFKAWKIGRKGMDDGLALFIFSEDRKLRIEVGYGLEGQVPDAIASRIINEIIVPKIQAGDPNGAVLAGVGAIVQVVSGKGLPAGSQDGRQGRQAQRVPLSKGQMILFAIVAIGFLILMITHPSLAMLLLFSILSGGRGGGGRHGGGGFGGGGGFSGGGGSSGGGGASGSW